MAYINGNEVLFALRETGGGSGSGENGATFTPNVSADGIISWTNDKGLSNPTPVNIKGDTYTLTESDKSEIAEQVLALIPNGNEVAY